MEDFLNKEHSIFNYIIVPAGDAEKTKIIESNKTLLERLALYKPYFKMPEISEANGKEHEHKKKKLGGAVAKALATFFDRKKIASVQKVADEILKVGGKAEADVVDALDEKSVINPIASLVQKAKNNGRNSNKRNY